MFVVSQSIICCCCCRRCFYSAHIGRRLYNNNNNIVCTQCSNIHSTVNAFAAYYLCVCVGYYYCFDCPCATNTRLVPSICKSTSCGDHRTQLLDTRLLVSTSVSQRNDIFERTLCANVPSNFVYYYLILVVVYEF